MNPVPPLFGPYGRQSLEHAERLVENGANAVWFHMFDESAFALCAAHGLAPCVEFKTFRADFSEYPELIPIGVDGKPIRYGRLVQGICLSQKSYLARIEEALVAGITTYRPTGIWLDYLTYGGWFETPAPDLQESCFCTACVEEFCQATGIDAESPQAILAAHQKAWTRHKCERIADFAAHYAALIRHHLPGCTVGAYMCPWLPDEYEGALGRIFAQDYDLLAPAIDVFTPLIYAAKSGRPPFWAREWLENADGLVPAGSKVQLILDVLDFPQSLEAVTDARDPGWGFQIFGGAEIFAEPDKARTFLQAVETVARSR